MDEPPDAELSPEALLAAGEAELRTYRRELARQLNAGIDTLVTTFDEALPLASTIRQSASGLRRLARDARQRSQRFEWWWYVTDGGRLTPPHPFGGLVAWMAVSLVYLAAFVAPRPWFAPLRLRVFPHSL